MCVCVCVSVCVCVCVCVLKNCILYTILYTIITNTTHYIHHKHFKRDRHVDICERCFLCFGGMIILNHTLIIASKYVKKYFQSFANKIR